MGKVAHNRTPVKSEQTALIYWGLKGLNEMKTKALYRDRQAGECLMTHTSPNSSASKSTRLVASGFHRKRQIYSSTYHVHSLAIMTKTEELSLLLRASTVPPFHEARMSGLGQN